MSFPLDFHGFSTCSCLKASFFLEITWRVDFFGNNMETCFCLEITWGTVTPGEKKQLSSDQKPWLFNV